MSRPSEPPASRQSVQPPRHEDRRAPAATRLIDCTASTPDETAVTRPPRGRAARESRATVVTRASNA